MVDNKEPADIFLKKSLSGLKWISILQFWQQIVLILVNIILARLLVPADFGIVAIITTITGIMISVIDIGLNAAIIQRNEIDNKHFSTAFYINIVLSIALSFLVYLMAPLLSSFFKMESMTKMLQLFSCIFVIRAFISVQLAIYERNMWFKKVSQISIIAILFGMITKIILALYGFGAWSIILGELLNQLIFVILIWFFSNWRPQLSLVNSNSFKELFSFGSSIFASNLIGSLSQKLDVIIVGKTVSTYYLGIYSMAYNFCQLIPAQINAVVNRVMFPSFSRIQDQNDLMIKTYNGMIKYVSIIGTPMLIGLMFVAPEFVNVVLSDKWMEIVPIMQVLCFYSLANVMGGLLWSQLLKAKGRSFLVLNMTIVRLIALIVFILIGSKWGLMGIAFALAIYSWTFRIIFQHIVNKTIKMSMFLYYQSLLPAIINTAIMAFVLVVLRHLSLFQSLSDLNRLIALIIIGTISYIICFRIIFKEDFIQLTILLKKMFV